MGASKNYWLRIITNEAQMVRTISPLLKVLRKHIILWYKQLNFNYFFALGYRIYLHQRWLKAKMKLKFRCLIFKMSFCHNF